MNYFIDIGFISIIAVLLWGRMELSFNDRIKVIGSELNLLTIKYKNLSAKQSRSLHVHLHDETPKSIPKGRGKEALFPGARTQ